MNIDDRMTRSKLTVVDTELFGGQECSDTHKRRDLQVMIVTRSQLTRGSHEDNTISTPEALKTAH
jgi:hypothetical protein